jgi:hypothetical protein
MLIALTDISHQTIVVLLSGPLKCNHFLLHRLGHHGYDPLGLIVVGPSSPRRFMLRPLGLHATVLLSDFQLPSFFSEPRLSVEEGSFLGLRQSAFPQLIAREILPDTLPLLVHLSLARFDAVSKGILCLAGEPR